MCRYIPIRDCTACPHLKITPDFTDPLQNNDSLEIWICSAEDKTIMSRKEKEDPDPKQPEWCPLESFKDTDKEPQEPQTLRVVSLEIYPDFTGCYIPVMRKDEVFRFATYNDGLVLTNVPGKSIWNTSHIRKQVEEIAKVLENQLNGRDFLFSDSGNDVIDGVTLIIWDALKSCKTFVNAFLLHTKPTGNASKIIVGIKLGDSGFCLVVPIHYEAITG